MWHWIKRLRDWVMSNMDSQGSGRQRLTQLAVGYEKAGLRVQSEPVPWNAEAVYVEALFRHQASTFAAFFIQLRSPEFGHDLALHFGGNGPVKPERVEPIDFDTWRALFRLGPINKTTRAELWSGNQRLRRFEIPYISKRQYMDGLRLSLPTVAINLSGTSVTARSYVSSQCKGLTASALLKHRDTVLLPAVDLPLEIEIRSDRNEERMRIPLRVSPSQLVASQALITATPAKKPRIGAWTVSWLLDGARVAEKRLRAVSRSSFERALQVTTSRYVTQSQDGEVAIVSDLPEEGTFARLGPCFVLRCREEGMAGLCTLTTRAIGCNGSQRVLDEQEFLVTDGPTPYAPGTLGKDDLEQIQAIELAIGDRSLCCLPLTETPTVRFTSEGGFKPVFDFSWTPSAERQLAEKLNQLLDQPS